MSCRARGTRRAIHPAVLARGADFTHRTTRPWKTYFAGRAATAGGAIATILTVIASGARLA